MQEGKLTAEQASRVHGAYYDGDKDPDYLSYMWDAKEGVYVLRILPEDETYPCGEDCCGWISAVVELPKEELERLLHNREG